MKLVVPSLEHVPSYKDALERGFSSDNTRPIDSPKEELIKIAADSKAFTDGMIDRTAAGGDITLPDGSKVKRLPGYRMWMWDGAFCGSIGFRWQPGTSELPPYCLGHIGYAVPAWKQRKGYASEALRQLLPMAKAEGLTYVELTTDPDNLPSQRVILANGGEMIGTFLKEAAYGGKEGLRWRIPL